MSATQPAPTPASALASALAASTQQNPTAQPPAAGAPVQGEPPAQHPAATSPPAQPDRPSGVAEAEWAALGDPGKAAILRERAAATEAQRALAEALTKVQKYEDASKSEAQRAADALAAAQKTADEAAARAGRLEAAAQAGLDLSLAPRLVGTTPEELAADARALAAMVTVPQSQPAQPVPGPRPDLSVGAPPADRPTSLGDAISAHYSTTKTT